MKNAQAKKNGTKAKNTKAQSAKGKSEAEKPKVVHFPRNEARGEEVKGPLRQPKAPMPPQHQPRPGIEAKITPRPKYEGSKYKAAGKLKNKVALITGGDSGIGRSVAV